MPEPFTDEELAYLESVFDAAREGRTPELAAALDAGVPANLTTAGGDTLLVLAAYHVQPAAVRLLLDARADTGRINDRGQTALAAAVFRQSTDIVRMLLDAGADPRLGERSAYDIAAFFDLPEVIALLDAVR